VCHPRFRLFLQPGVTGLEKRVEYLGLVVEKGSAGGWVFYLLLLFAGAGELRGL